MSISDDFHVYDTTLRDGAQQEGLALSVADKIAIAQHLDELGVGFIEGGWPGAVPKDTEFFERAKTELNLRNATFAAFGATRKPGVAAADDPQVAALRDSGAGVVTLVAKSHDAHVERALRTTLDENLRMVADTVRHLRENGQRVFLDTEHFFDGYRANRAYALEVVRVAAEAGADVVALCDTNGGTLPRELQDVVRDVLESTGARLGIHCHNDAGCAVANSIAAVEAGVTHVQGTINGYGERTGNADLLAIVANLELKREMRLLPEGNLSESFRIAHAIAEVTNVPPSNRAPYVGLSAFAHKAGLHASAIKVDPDLYQHTDPALVGNDMRMLVSEMAGRASIELKGRELGFDLSNDRDLVGRVADRVKDLESRGYTFEAADASFSLLLTEEVDGKRPSFFDVESWRVITESRADGEAVSESTVKLVAGGEREI
ncbi:MAG: citramalate synthase, partial [Kribbellaceae bacterium]|nr:citramalate synthase [Kribbellaceae bacterium]